MSIVAFKRKSIIQYGSNVSGKAVNQYWLNQGPYGTQNSITSVGSTTKGFGLAASSF